MSRILIVEDEEDIAGLVKYHLEKEGFTARTVVDGKQALDLIVRKHPDLIVLDLMLPGVDGLEVCRRLRAQSATQGIPIIMLTARAEEVDRIIGLELGADDYVPKPFSPRELVARVKAVLRRTAAPLSPSEAPVSAGPLRLDPTRHEVIKGDRLLDLSAMEFRLLEFFLRHRGQLNEFSIPADHICFEITETAAIHHLSKAQQLIHAFRGRGGRIALDDFGSGFSSFRYLKTLPVDYIKIDGSFVSDMLSNPGDLLMVEAITQIAHTLGIKVIAEHASTIEIISRLREISVDRAQGFGIGLPVPVKEAWKSKK